MKLKDIDLTKIKEKYKFKQISIGNCDKWYIGSPTQVFENIPSSFMNKEVVEQKDFFGNYIIEVEKNS